MVKLFKSIDRRLWECGFVLEKETATEAEYKKLRQLANGNDHFVKIYKTMYDEYIMKSYGADDVSIGLSCKEASLFVKKMKYMKLRYIK